MNRSKLIEHARHWLLASSLLLAGLATSAQDIDPPGRVARLNLLQGAVSQLPAGDAAWSPAEINRPLTSGDSLRAEPGARLELHSGSTAVRLEGLNSAGVLDISHVDDNTTRLTLGEGRLNLRVRNLYPGEQVEIDTPNLALTVQQPGSYDLDVDPRSGTTRVATRYGSATVYGENAESLTLAANGQQLSFTGRKLAQAAPPALLRNDAFDLWAEARDRAEDQSISARYVSRDVPGYQQLDAFGDWQDDTTYGPVWIPRITATEWAPYRYGQWRWIAPWGWTWVDDAPWGFAPSHYGRWTQIGPRWAWVPGPRSQRPTYAPALVGFSDGQPGRSDWNRQAGPDRRPGPGASWFPLAPGEAWHRGDRGDRRPFFQGRPDAVSATPLPGTRPVFNDRPPWHNPARSQAEQAQRAQIQADEARQRQQEALQRPSLERQAQQDRLQREYQLQQLQRQQYEQQQRQQPSLRPQFPASEALRREQQAQQERMQRDVAQREQIQRQQQQQRMPQNQVDQPGGRPPMQGVPPGSPPGLHARPMPRQTPQMLPGNGER